MNRMYSEVESDLAKKEEPTIEKCFSCGLDLTETDFDKNEAFLVEIAKVDEDISESQPLCWDCKKKMLKEPVNGYIVI